MIIQQDQCQKQSLRLQKLYEANQKLAREESVESLIPVLMESVRDVTDADASSFFSYDPAGQVLRFFSIRDDCIDDVVEKSLKQLEIPLGEGIVGWVAKERQPLIVADAQKDGRLFKNADAFTGYQTRSILGVPVIYGDELLGVMEVINPTGKDCFDSDDQDLLVSFADLAAVAIFRARLLQERLQQQKLQIQMDTAAKIQALFRPPPPDIGFGSHIWAYSRPARFVGGDLYDIIPMPGDSWLIYVADVSDKGLPAALIMAALWYRIRSEAGLHKDVAGLMQTLNVELEELLADEGYFATIAIAQYWPAQGRLEIACGGHPPPFRISAGEVSALSVTNGPALGVIRGARYQKTVHRLAPGEAILLLTDGVTEAENPSGAFFGQSRIEAILAQSGELPRGPVLMSAIEKWQAAAEPNDDLTLLEIWRSASTGT